MLSYGEGVAQAARRRRRLRQDDYPATKVIEEPFCAALGPEKRHKADAAKCPVVNPYVCSKFAGGDKAMLSVLRRRYGMSFQQKAFCRTPHSATSTSPFFGHAAPYSAFPHQVRRAVLPLEKTLP